MPHATSEQDLTVDLSNYAIDVSSRCGPSLAARDTVEPADLTVDLSNCVIYVSSGCGLSLVARDTVALAVEKLTDTSSLSLAARVTRVNTSLHCLSLDRARTF